MIDYGGVKARVTAFDAEHGRNIYDGNGHLLFEDGACREVNPLGLLQDAPQDPHERAKAILQYWEIKWKQAVQDFDHRKREYTKHASMSLKQKMCVSAPDVDAVEAELKALAAEVKKIQKGYDKARQDVKDTLPAAIRERQEQDRKNRAEMQNLIERIKEIEI